MKKIWVRVPASSGNLGPGFDVLGAALALHNELEVEWGGPGVSGRVEGEGAGLLTAESRNLILDVLRSRLGRKAFHVTITNRIPMARGLGSSAAARLAAHAAAGALLGRPAREALDLAAAEEGHPDNAAASFFGGLCSCLPSDGKLEVFRWAVPEDLMALVCLPEFELATETARRALPRKVDLRDAVRNIAGATGVLGAILHKRYDELARAMADFLHQPYRAKLVPGLEEALKAAPQAGALGACLSGAGPSVLAILRRGADTWKIGEALVHAFRKEKINSRFLVVPFDNRGLLVEKRA